MIECSLKTIVAGEASTSIVQLPQVKTVANELVSEVLRWQLAKRRSGTHSVLTRAGVSGGGRKPWKQKGTGNARSGSNTSPLWVGGGVAHGPKCRSYDYKINSRQKRQVIQSLLYTKFSTSMVGVIEYSSDLLKTKHASLCLSKLLPDGTKKVLVVSEDIAQLRGFRNIAKVEVVSLAGLNGYSIVNSDFILLTSDVLPKLVSSLSTCNN